MEFGEMKHERVPAKMDRGLSEEEQKTMIEELAKEKGIEIIDNPQSLKPGDKVLTMDRFNQLVEVEVPEEYQVEKKSR